MQDDLISDDDIKPENIKVRVSLMISGSAKNEALTWARDLNKTTTEVLELWLETWAMEERLRRKGLVMR